MRNSSVPRASRRSTVRAFGFAFGLVAIQHSPRRSAGLSSVSHSLGATRHGRARGRAVGAPPCDPSVPAPQTSRSSRAAVTSGTLVISRFVIANALTHGSVVPRGLSD